MLARPKPGSTFAVMYHYVRPAENTGLNYLDLEEFRLQLDFLQANFGILGTEDWNALKAGEFRPGVFLTFDDGLSDGYDFVLPELQERGLTGQFYICSEPLSDASWLPVHVTHALLREIKPEVILDELRLIVGEHNLTPPDDSISNQAYLTHSYEESKKLVKKVINYGYKQEQWRDPLNHLVEHLFGERAGHISKSWYMSPDSIRRIAQEGHIVGSHTCSHRLLSRLDSLAIRQELRVSKHELEAITTGTVEDFCFPYGGKNSYNHAVLDELSSSGYRASFAVEPREIKPKDLETIYELPRYDCTEVSAWINKPSTT